jgi:hypothetical protein
MFEGRECYFMCSGPNKHSVLLEKVGERLRYYPKVSNKFPVVAGQAQKASEFLDVDRRRPLRNRSNFGWISPNTLLTYHMAQISNFPLGKRTLGEFFLPLILGQEYKDLSDMHHMLFISSTINENVIKENQYKLLKARC